MKELTKKTFPALSWSLLSWFTVSGGLVFVLLVMAFATGSPAAQRLLAWIITGSATGLLVIICRLTWLAGFANRHLDPVLLISSDKEVLVEFETLSRSLICISRRSDNLFREQALQQLSYLTDSATELAAGKITYVDTETWRIAYDHLLRSPGLHTYRSVAWIKSPDYWRDVAGLHSMATNFELVEEGRLQISRTCILDDPLWPANSLPTEEILNWVSDQHFRNIEILLVRQSDLELEPELLSDFGIYGYRAVGTQLADDLGHTSKFQLSFDFADVEHYEQIWQRLQVYSISLGKLLDRTGTC